MLDQIFGDFSRFGIVFFTTSDTVLDRHINELISQLLSQSNNLKFEHEMQILLERQPEP